jgi:hypothetical protein
LTTVKSATVAGSQEVTEIQTAIGPVITTAPETLPTSSASGFHAGERVRHPRFGEGEVVDAVGDIVLVRFGRGKSRKIQSGYVTRVSAA